ncbi:MAG: peptidase M61, partial [Bacteroidia bacterium]
MAKSLNLSIELSFPLAIQHQVHVLMEFEQTTSKPCEISMPVWTPGSYLVREFAKSVETVQWSENGTDWHRARKINKSTWSIPAKKGSRVQVQYDVYAREM